jgi:hypothetical protein
VPGRDSSGTVNLKPENSEISTTNPKGIGRAGPPFGLIRMFYIPMTRSMSW